MKTHCHYFFQYVFIPNPYLHLFLNGEEDIVIFTCYNDFGPLQWAVT